MRQATTKDKDHITDLLTCAFTDNQSVNYIIKQDEKRLKRIKALMSYSFEICKLFGEVYLSDDDHACALIVYPHKKRTSFKSILLDIQLIYNCIGFFHIGRALKRELKIGKIQPKEKKYYLWFIGVDPAYQSKGIGSEFLMEVIEDSEKKHLPIYLETSTLRNLPFYTKMGFSVYHQLNLSYQLYFLRRFQSKI
ncbi:GNAT family N-acetyltransferase [Daejeonella oryzae]|uniref:GNAT family N-acetyltransferase n=1 Tax=Daejeonella oryzae TaxID=1122943 RepID=UPI0004082473|nr:GNAT family N-acetyltransferase [Daejeonella oryzae]